MRLCIFNSLSQHHEMFAHVLDYCKEKNTHIDIYTNIQHNYGWLDFYEKNFSVVSWFPISFFNPDAYEYVFLLTDNDSGYAPFWNDKTRVIVVEHDGKRKLNLRSYFTLQTRQFKLRNPPSHPNTAILPAWNNKFHTRFNKLTVVSVGNASKNLNLPSLFSNFNDIQFILIDRSMDTSHHEPNVTRYNSLDASSLIEFAAKAHYILFWPTTSFSHEHKHNSMSGSFPLAYSVGTPLLMPESFIEPIGLDGILGIEHTIHLEKPTESLLNRVLTQRDSLLKKRNCMFDSLLFGLSTPISTNTAGMYTAVIVEPRKHSAMRFVLNNFLENLDTRWNFMVFHGTENKEWLEEILDSMPPLTRERITVVNLNTANLEIREYSKLIASASFLEQIPTETFLVFQTDTMISPSGKDIIYEFLEYDYVGAPWPHSNLRESYNVGNGGLSLRKKSKMLEIIHSSPYVFPEDVFFCMNQTVPLYKPTWERAKLFSIESIYSPRTFGLHKAWTHISVKQLEEQFPGVGELKKFDESK